MYKVIAESVLFKCIPMADNDNDEGRYISVVEFAQQPLFDDSNASIDDKIPKILESLPITFSVALEIITWGQSSN